MKSGTLLGLEWQDRLNGRDLRLVEPGDDDLVPCRRHEERNDVKFYVNGAQQGTIRPAASPRSTTAPHRSKSAAGPTAPTIMTGSSTTCACGAGRCRVARFSSLYSSPGSFGEWLDPPGLVAVGERVHRLIGNANTLTGQGSPVFSMDVPYTAGAPAVRRTTTPTPRRTTPTRMHSLAFFNGSATTTYAYDAIGNLATTTGAATSTFNWDYRNRMIRAWVAGATSTYAYDHTTARMRQVVGSTTTDYPNKFFSIATTTLHCRDTTATSTAYIWHGDTLVATIEQVLVNGVATGTPTTYYVHPDHLGSTNVDHEQRRRREASARLLPVWCAADQHRHRCERSPVHWAVR